MKNAHEIDIRQVVEDFLRTSTPEEMMEALRQSDPSGILASFHTSVLDAQPNRTVRKT